MFDAYGPFTLHTHDEAGIDKLYDDIRADETDNLENGIGIYIIALRANGKLLPCYAGRTQDGFGTRLKQHFDKGKFEDLNNEALLDIFLIARTTPQGRVITKEEATGRDLLFIEQLEQKLIGRCAELNEDLLNVHYRSGQKNFYVAGFQDGKAKRSPAAECLGKLLGT